MKKLITTATSIILAGAVSLGIILSQPKEEFKEVAAQTVTISKPVQEIKLIELVNEPVQENIVAQKPLNEVKEEVTAPTYEDTWVAVFKKVQGRTWANETLNRREGIITSTVMAKFNTNPELYIDINSTVEKCVSFLDSIHSDDLNRKHALTSNALARQDCGL